MYKILIGDPDKNNFKFATVLKETTEDVRTIDGDTVQIGTGEYKLVIFESEDVEKVKEEYKKLLEAYREKELNVIKDVSEVVTTTITIGDETSSSAGNDDAGTGAGDTSGGSTGDTTSTGGDSSSSTPDPSSAT